MTNTNAPEPVMPIVDGFGLPIEDVRLSGPALDAHDARKEGGPPSKDSRETILAHTVQELAHVVGEILRQMPLAKLTADYKEQVRCQERLNRIGDILQTRWLGD